MEIYEKYIDDIRSGVIPSCREMKLAVARFVRMYESGNYVFDYEKAVRVFRFISLLHHYTGSHAGEPFILQPWQQFIVVAVYGFYDKITGRRIVRSVYIEMARKQGKSAFASALALYHFIADGEMNAEVYFAANSKDQARIAFTMCKNFVLSLDSKQQILRPMRDTIEYRKTLSILRVLAADDTKLDGFNASMFLIDEYHAAKDSRLKDVLQSSQGMRSQPMKIIITTAGFDKLGVCYQFRTMCEEVLSGVKEDDSLFAAIFTLDENDDWKDENVWIKSNPNLGITVDKQYLREQIRLAENSPSEEIGVKTKNINIWCDSEQVWIPDHYILEDTEYVDLESFKGIEAYAGVDLSSTSDMTSMSFCIPFNDKFYFKTFYYLPEAALKEKRFSELYGEWRRKGYIIITPGNVVDYDYILNDLIRISKSLYISCIGYDPWNATQFKSNAEDNSLPMLAIQQTIGNFNKPTKEIERLILSGKAVIDNNPINRYCYRNVSIKMDWNGNQKPTKEFAEKKIDGVISEINALYCYLASPRYNSVIY